ncbi:MAG: hypothetical protein ABI414_10035 [Devosia sp.]
MPPLSRFYYRHSAFSTAIAPAAVQRDRDRDWDNGALLIIAIVAVPTILASVVAIVLAM